MRRVGPGLLLSFLAVFLVSFQRNERAITLFLIGDSTMASYDLEADYEHRRYPLHGWGQCFQSLFNQEEKTQLRARWNATEVRVDNRAKGGRSTRTFVEEGRWAEVLSLLKPGDWVLIQFGHNDSAENKPDRYTSLAAYKAFLTLFVQQSREKGATPVLLTPVSRNYPWIEQQLSNAHGAYPGAVKEVATEQKVKCIDLTRLSGEAFTLKGKAYVTSNYFMNLAEGTFEAYPKGLKDNTHFQKEGAEVVARLVYEAFK